MSTPADSWRERAWEAYPHVLAIEGGGAPHRAGLLTPTVTAADLGVPHSWGITVCAGARLPADDDAAAALAWCVARDRGLGWRVSLPGRLALPTGGPWAGQPEHEGSAVFAMAADPAAAAPAAAPPGLELELAPSYEQVVAGYGGWMDDEPLARLLVTPADLVHPSRRFVVGLVDGRAIGCAFVWWAAGTAYLSGIGVVADQRGLGFGRALTSAAMAMGARAGGAATAPDVVWMFATDEGAALYGRLGFTRVDTEVLLGPSSS